jgi:2-succinyl-6-hydroxy-2,4-cyclohexadiene-1-carboxylate synthase
MTPLVLLHGFTGSPQSFQPLIARVAPWQRAFAPALLGHAGNSAGPVGDSTPPASGLAARSGFELEVDRIAASIRQNVDTPVLLLGYSLGARIALGLCVRHPELVTRATCIGVHPGIEDEQQRVARRAADAGWCDMLETRGIGAFADAWENQALFASQTRLSPEVREQQRSERLRHSARGLALALRRLGLAEMPNYWPSLASLGMPIDLVVGALDDKFTALARRAHFELNNSRLHIVPHSGHNVVLEAPGAVSVLLRRAA